MPADSENSYQQGKMGCLLLLICSLSIGITNVRHFFRCSSSLSENMHYILFTNKHKAITRNDIDLSLNLVNTISMLHINIYCISINKRLKKHNGEINKIKPIFTNKLKLGNISYFI